MIRKIICFIVLSAFIGLIAACSPNTVNMASKSISSEIPQSTASEASSITPTETPTNSTSAAASSAPSEIPSSTESAAVSSDIPSEAPENTPVVVNGEIPSVIPTNQSVNYAWTGHMCEAGGFIYFVSDGGNGKDAPEYIARMSHDGSQGLAVTGKYAGIFGLVADDANLYFIVATSRELNAPEELYALPLKGGKEKKLMDWQYNVIVQTAGGRIYWSQYSGPDINEVTASIMSMKPDGTDVKKMVSVPAHHALFYFLAEPDGLYYSSQLWGAENDCSLFHADLQGKNVTQLSKEDLGNVDILFYDQGNLYFTTRNEETGLYSSVNRLDADGKKSVVIEHIDYSPEVEAGNAFCGVSGNVFYYFDFEDTGNDKITMDLHGYDIGSKQDKVILKTQMDEPSTLYSVGGKEINVLSSPGFYIVGNDVYYSFFSGS